LISCRKKSGFTVTELVIVMTLTVVVLGIIWTIFSVSNKIISNVTIKSDLQREGQAIQEQLSNIGMQATGIEPIMGDDGNEVTGEVKKITINSYDKYGNRKQFEIENASGRMLIDGKEVSSYLGNITINKEIIHKDKAELINNTYIDFSITLSRNRNYDNKPILYPIKVRTVFRNKNTLDT
jgi:hypothetical protein